MPETPNPYQPEDNEPNDSEQPIKEQRRTFLERWLKRRDERIDIFREPGAEEEDDDDQEAAEEKPSTATRKWRRAFSRLFPNWAAPEYAADHVDEAASIESLPLPQYQEEEPQGLLTINHDQETVPPVEPVVAELPLSSLETPLESSDSLAPEQSEVTEATIPPLAESSPELPAFPEAPPLPLSIGEAAVAPATRPETPAIPRQPERTERGPAAAAFVAAEVLSRRRDRKLKREARKLERKLTKLEKDNRRQLEKLEPVMAMPKAEQQASIVSEKPPTVLERIVTTFKPERTSLAPTEAASSPKAQPEVEPTLEKPSRMVKLEELLHTRPEIVKPEVVLHEVEKAAERDVPIEKVYEMRHEIKDDDTPFRPIAGGAREAVSKLPLQFPPPVAPLVVSRVAAAPRRAPSLTAVADTPLYRQAMYTGALAGIGLLVLLALYIINQ